MAFENLNSLEILNLQNNKLTRVPEEALEAIVDTATVIDIMGKYVWKCWIPTLQSVWNIFLISTITEVVGKKKRLIKSIVKYTDVYSQRFLFIFFFL